MVLIISGKCPLSKQTIENGLPPIAGSHFPPYELGPRRRREKKLISSLQSLCNIPCLPGCSHYSTHSFVVVIAILTIALFLSLSLSKTHHHCYRSNSREPSFTYTYTNDFLSPPLTHAYLYLLQHSQRIPVFLLLTFLFVFLSFVCSFTHYLLQRTLKNKRNFCSSTYREKIKYNPIHYPLKCFKTKKEAIHFKCTTTT